MMAAEALELARIEIPDLIITDIINANRMACIRAPACLCIDTIDWRSASINDHDASM